jgi:hypothetical protein
MLLTHLAQLFSQVLYGISAELASQRLSEIHRPAAGHGQRNFWGLKPFQNQL